MNSEETQVYIAWKAGKEEFVMDGTSSTSRADRTLCLERGQPKRCMLEGDFSSSAPRMAQKQRGMEVDLGRDHSTVSVEGVTLR